jgi:hypothetical protein
LICPTCGIENRDGVKFCARCGTRQPDPDPGYQSVYQQQHGEQPPPHQQPDPYRQPPSGAPYPGAMQPAAYAYTPPAGERRDIAITILLAIVTCGIYGLVWQYRMVKEIAADLGRTDINPGMEILLVILTCGIYGMYLCYKYPKLINEMQARRGLPVNDISVMTLLLAVFGLPIVSHALMQAELNKIWEMYGPR